MALIDKASLLMVPSTYEAGKLYNVLPSGNRAPDSTDQNSGYDQTRADFDFDRGTDHAATRIDENGVLQKYRENLLVRSNAFDTTWTNTSGAVTGGQSGYDGTNNAWKLEKTGNGGRIRQAVSLTGVNTFSVYAKAGTTNWLRLLFETISDSYYFDLENGVLGSSTSQPVNGKIESVGNGWYRCSITSNGTSGAVRIYPANDDLDVTGTSGSIFIQSAQLESGLVATDVLTSGATTAKAGVLVDMPRINFDANGENGSLLLEPSRKNKFQFSEYIEGLTKASSGTGSNPVLTTNYAISPEGIKNATRVQFDAGNGGTNSDISRLYDTFTIYGTTETLSVYLKSADGNNHTISMIMTNSNVKEVEVTNEWQRFDATQLNTSPDNFGIGLYGDNAATADILVYGFQLETGSYVSSYIPNHGESGGVTRAADVLGNSNNISGLFNDNEGTLYFETDDTIFKGEINNYNFFGLTESSNGSYFRFRGSNSTILTQSVGFGSTISFNPSGATFTKYLYKWDGTNIKLFIDGVERGSASQTATFNPDLFRIGFNFGFVSNTKQLLLFPEALSDAECVTLTTL